MSDGNFEDTRSAFTETAEKAGWKCRICANEISYEDKEAFFSTGRGLCSRCLHRTSKDSD